MTVISGSPGSGPLGLVSTLDESTEDEHAPGAGGAAANLSMFALALGVAGAVLGVTVVWFFAAIPLGLAAVVTGGLALRRPELGRHRARAVLGTTLGLVALLLGALSAILLPMAVHWADNILTGARDDITSQVNRIDRSLTRDVNRVDRTVSRDLRGLERQSQRELNQLQRKTAAELHRIEGQSGRDVMRLQRASAAELRRLEQRVTAAEKLLPAQADELSRQAQQLRAELAGLRTAMNGADVAAQTSVDAIATRVVTLEGRLGIPQPQPADPVIPGGPAAG